MTPSSRRRPADAAVANVRQLSQVCHKQGPASFDAFEKLANALLCLTIAHDVGGLHLTRSKDTKERKATLYGGRGADESAIRLRNDRFLKIMVSLFLGEDRYLRVGVSQFQYQADPEGNDWIFRYDYEREPGKKRYPAAHLHVRGAFTVAHCLPKKKRLEDVHFYSIRPTLEATIRLLIEQFRVPPANRPAVWQPALAESERIFFENAHLPSP